jgi:hypothetical protein
MATVKAKYKIVPTLTKATIQGELERVFKANSIGMSTYGLKGQVCYSWVKNAIADLGVVQEPYFNINAWDFFAGLPDINMKYFERAFSDTDNGAIRYDYSGVISQKIAFVFGFFTTSRYRPDSVKIIQNNDTFGTKVSKLTELKRKKVSEAFNPITHIGVYVNGTFYDFAQNMVRLDPKTNFVPIAYYEFYNDLVSKLK